jgi:hypothetical protein
MLAKWFEEAEEGETDSGRITYEFNCVIYSKINLSKRLNILSFCSRNLQKKSDHTVTSIDEEKNPWWKCLKGSLNEM